MSKDNSDPAIIDTLQSKCKARYNNKLALLRSRAVKRNWQHDSFINRFPTVDTKNIFYSTIGELTKLSSERG